MAEYINKEKLTYAIINTPLKALEGKDYNKEVFDTATDVVHEILNIIDEQPIAIREIIKTNKGGSEVNND